MRRIHYSLVLSILYLTVSFGQNSKTYKVNTIAFYNLENLFDTENDPITFDDDRTPDGKDHWTKEIYQDKLKNMARVIAEIGADVSGTTPAIIGEDIDVPSIIVKSPPGLQLHIFTPGALIVDLLP